MYQPLNDLSDVVDLPANAYESIMDYMLYRAYRKLGNLTEAASSKKEFDEGINLMKIVAVRRDNGLDSFSISGEQNV